jgi:hypothetical protein
LPAERLAVILRRGLKNVMSDRPSSDPMRRGGAALRVLAALVLLILVVANVLGVRERRAYAAEIARLRASMTDIERRRADAVVSGERHTLRLALELLRRQARLDRDFHLSVSVDSARMYLEREGALLRDMPVSIGAERQVGLPPDTVRLAVPRGVRTIVRVLGDTSSWEVPAWVYADRGIAADSTRLLRGALGPVAILLEGGAIIYTPPSAGPLNDSSYVLPGAIRARAEDLRAIMLNVAPGMRVFFY